MRAVSCYLKNKRKSFELLTSKSNSISFLPVQTTCMNCEITKIAVHIKLTGKFEKIISAVNLTEKENYTIKKRNYSQNSISFEVWYN